MRGEGSRSYGLRLLTTGPPVLTAIWIQADFSPCPISQVLWAVEDLFNGYKDV
jgi:hypothetical protein